MLLAALTHSGLPVSLTFVNLAPALQKRSCHVPYLAKSGDVYQET